MECELYLNKAVFEKILYTVFIAALFMSPQSGNNPNIHHLKNGYQKYGIIYVMEYYAAIKKKWNTDTYYHMDEPTSKTLC